MVLAVRPQPPGTVPELAIQPRLGVLAAVVVRGNLEALDAATVAHPPRPFMSTLQSAY